MPATSNPFGEMRQLPEQVVAQWHGDPDEKPRYLKLMEANLAFNTATDELRRKRVAWAAQDAVAADVAAAEDESFKLLVEAEQALLRIQLLGAALIVGAGGAVGAGALFGWVVAVVLQTMLVVAVMAWAWRTFSGYRTEAAARELVRAATVKDREARVKAREREERAAEDHVRELQEVARSENADAERGVRIYEKSADAPTG